MSDREDLTYFRAMVRLREFEQACLEGAASGEIHGELHTSVGHEAVAAGMAPWLRDSDALVSTHRNHYHALIKGVPRRELLAEIFEREAGLCRGRGGHMHPFDPGHNFSATGIVGAALPVALGYAYAFALEGDDRVAVAMTGDGGANHGTFHESLNIAAAWALPFVIVVENNHWAISVGAAEVTATATIAERAAAYGVPGEVVDGTDPEAVSAAFGKAITRARNDGVPGVVEALCERFQGHYEGDVQGYRPLAERERVRSERDPIELARRDLLARRKAKAEELDQIEAEARAEMSTMLEQVRCDPLPDASKALEYVFSSTESRNGN